MSRAVYHAIVRRIVRSGFARMSATHDASHVVAQFAGDGFVVFSGDSLIGGEYRGKTQIADWFARLFKLFPDLRIEPLTVVVEGWPWNTRVATRFAVSATLPDGTPYANEGMQFVRLSFGRIHEDRIYEDTAKLERALGLIARA